MSNSEAFDDIGPSAPTYIAIAGRIRRAKEYLKLAEDHLNDGELGMADRRLHRAANEAAAKKED